jgi:hypothetical protein
MKGSQYFRCIERFVTRAIDITLMNVQLLSLIFLKCRNSGMLWSGMDIMIDRKMQAVADQLAPMHGRAFADAFLEDYVIAKLGQSGLWSSRVLAVPTAQTGDVEKDDRSDDIQSMSGRRTETG